jgi:hypothetical protein
MVLFFFSNASRQTACRRRRVKIKKNKKKSVGRIRNEHSKTAGHIVHTIRGAGWDSSAGAPELYRKRSRRRRVSKEFERHYFFPRGNKFVLHTLSDPENYKYMWTMRSGPGGSTSSMPGPNTGQYLSCVWTSSLCKYINQRTGIIKRGRIIERLALLCWGELLAGCYKRTPTDHRIIFKNTNGHHMAVCIMLLQTPGR